MPTPDISVIVPAFNAASYIVEALDSVLAQTLPAREVIVVDDGSTDGTAEIVSTWGKKSPIALRLIRQTNSGVSATRNRALSIATGRLIAPLDSDDIFCREHHAVLATPFEANPKIVISFADQAIFDHDGTVAESFLDTRLPKIVRADPISDSASVIRGSAFTSLLNGNYVPTSGSMFIREMACAVGGYDVDIRTSEDREFLLRLACLGPFALTRTVVAKKREHQSSLTGRASNYVLSAGAYTALRSLRMKIAQFRITTDEKAALDRALLLAAKNLFYWASYEGVPAYLAQLGDCKDVRHLVIALHPKTVLRAIARSARQKLK